MTPFPVQEFRSQLLLDPEIRYMNAGTSGPIPIRSYEAQCEHLRWMSWNGPGSFEAYRRTLKIEGELRRGLARFFGGTPEQYALTQNTSEGINIVLNGFPWSEGDEVVTTDMEHGGMALPLYHAAGQGRFVLKIMRLSDGADPLEAFKAALTPRTRMLAVSHIAYTDGRRLPLDAWIHRAHEAGIAVLVDAAQSAGQLPVNWPTMGADFVALPGQKWLLGPEGTGALYLSEEWTDRLVPDRVGWAGEAGFDLEGNYSLKPSAQKFEVATRDPAASLGLSRSLEFIEAFGMEAIAERNRQLSAFAREGLQRIPGVRVLGPDEPESYTGLIAFRLGDVPPPKLVKHLWKTAKVVSRWIPEPHPPAARISLHAYNTEEEIEAVLGAVHNARMTL